MLTILPFLPAHHKIVQNFVLKTIHFSVDGIINPDKSQ